MQQLTAKTFCCNYLDSFSTTVISPEPHNFLAEHFSRVFCSLDSVSIWNRHAVDCWVIVTVNNSLFVFLHSISKCYSTFVISDWMWEKGGQCWDTACVSLCVFNTNIFSFMIFKTIYYGHYSYNLHAKYANSCGILYLRHCFKCVLILRENK